MARRARQPLAPARRERGWLRGGLVALSALGGCGEPTQDAAVEAAHAAQPEGVVLARVGDEVIDEQDLRRYLALHPVTPREALRELEDQALLLAEARRRGFRPASAAAAARADEQLLAQRVLLDIEARVPLAGPSSQEVAAYLAEHEPEIVRETRRDCVQVLLQQPAGGEMTPEQERLAAEYAERALARMRVEGVEAVWANQPPQYQGLRVLSQYLPPATPSTPMPEEFRSAVFALDAPGPVASPVRTRNGWHIIGVTAIHPPIEAGSTEALQIARERLVTIRRREAFEALLVELRERFPVSVSGPNLEAVLPALGEAQGPAT